MLAMNPADNECVRFISSYFLRRFLRAYREVRASDCNHVIDLHRLVRSQLLYIRRTIFCADGSTSITWCRSSVRVSRRHLQRGEIWQRERVNFSKRSIRLWLSMRVSRDRVRRKCNECVTTLIFIFMMHHLLPLEVVS
jgi:hypothetical protein